MITADIGHGRGILPQDAARSIARIDAAIGGVLQVTEAGRTYARQLDLYTKWINGVPGYNRALHPDDPLANHVLMDGRRGAIDTEAVNWGQVTEAFLNANGWFRTASDEYWHYEYFFDRDQFFDVETELGDMMDELERLSVVVGGTYERAKNGESISQRLDKVLSLVQQNAARLDRLEVVIGGTYERAKNGESISQRVDKVIKQTK